MEAMQRAMIKRIAVIVTLAGVLAGSWVAWRIQPWMQPGEAVRLGSWQIDGKDYQVWQRKTSDLLEAFATGFFVRTKTNRWNVFCLDFEDYYAPKIELRINGSQIVVLRNGTDIGEFDPIKISFRRATDGALLNAVLVSDDPPSDWWLNH